MKHSPDKGSTTEHYYPFGMEMPGRKFQSTNGYRYGFNGKEQDKDMHSLTAYDYGFRIYNPGIAKFLSVDPLTQQYPWYTPYQFAGNKPINCIDIDGLEEELKIEYWALDANKPVFSAPDFMTGLNNACGNVMSFAWNCTIGGFHDALAGIWNFGVDLFSGNLNDITFSEIIVDEIISVNEYFDHTSPKQMLKDFGDAATNLNNYTLGVQTLLFGRLMRGETPGVDLTNGKSVATAFIEGEYVFGEQWGTAASYAVEGRTTSLLGTGKGYFHTRLRACKNLVENEANPGGFSILNGEGIFTTTAGRQAFWDNVNKPWLDKIIERGDRLALTDNPFDQQALFLNPKNLSEGMTLFGQEIKYLQEKGYTFINGEAIPPSK